MRVFARYPLPLRAFYSTHATLQRIGIGFRLSTFLERPQFVAVEKHIVHVNGICAVVKEFYIGAVRRERGQGHCNSLQ